MILRPRARPQALLRAFARPSNNSFRFQQRRLEHTVPELGSNNIKGQFFEEHGVPEFLTPKTFKQTWLQYQQHLCDDLNSTIEGQSKYAAQRPLELHQTLSHNPEYASVYNAAAMLHFNHFFWESLSTEVKVIPKSLREAIEADFESVEDLRIEMLQHADAMFGNGFVWLVREGNFVYGGKIDQMPLRILCTYNAGSPYPGAHKRKQARDMATADTSRFAERLTTPQNRVGAMGAFAGNEAEQTWPNALQSQPILCLNNWQHMYMHDYGILGRQAYLSAWWERIDWDVVQSRFIMSDAQRERAPNPLNQFGVKFR